MVYIRKTCSLLLVLALMIAGTGCSKVQRAIYDAQTRQAYKDEAHKIYEESTSSKETRLRNAMVETAEKYHGTKYKYASVDPKKGFDCSGLVHFCGKKNGLELSRSSRSLAVAGKQIPWKKAKRGDLMIFGFPNRIEHVGIVTKNNGDGLFIVHATTQRGVITENVLVSSYWKKRIMYAVDFNSLL